MSLNLIELQKQVAEWTDHNFGNTRPIFHPLLGLGEELGELYHAHLKIEQGIREGTSGKLEAEAQDAVGDMLIYLVDLCNLNGWSFNKVLTETWEKVRQRDWRLYPKDGVSE